MLVEKELVALRRAASLNFRGSRVVVSLLKESRRRKLSERIIGAGSRLRRLRKPNFSLCIIVELECIERRTVPIAYIGQGPIKVGT